MNQATMLYQATHCATREEADVIVSQGPNMDHWSSRTNAGTEWLKAVFNRSLKVYRADYARANTYVWIKVAETAPFVQPIKVWRNPS